MRFFEHQSRARRWSWGLVVVFLALVVALSAVNAVVVTQVFHFSKDQRLPIFLFSAVVFIISTAISLLHGKDGEALARWLGGEPLVLPCKTPAEKRLFNVIEEMSIASGVPIPAVFILPEDLSINAFAAGTDPRRTVIAVTRGALIKLTRDELQAVIGHEFSHLLNEDMELNLRLAGLVSGFFVFVKSGIWILRNTHTRGRFSTRRNQDTALPLMMLGLAFSVFGGLGFLCGRFLQALISQQREYLADASSAQFTRHPQALAQALTKIAYHSGSEVTSPNTMSMSHIFFAEPVKSFWSQLISTHPPVRKRVGRLIPGKTMEKLIQEMAPQWKEMENDSQEWIEAETTKRENLEQAKTAAAYAFVEDRHQAQKILKTVASPGLAHFRFSEEVLQKFPLAIKEKIQDFDGARSALFSILMQTQSAPLQEQFLKTLKMESPVHGELVVTFLDFLSSRPELRFVFFKLSLGVLRQQSADLRQQLLEQIEKLFSFDQKWTLSEVLYYLICEEVLTPNPLKPAASVQNLQLIQKEFLRVLVAAEKEQNPEVEISVHLREWAQVIPWLQSPLALTEEDFNWSLITARNDFAKLASVELRLKQKLIESLLKDFRRDHVLKPVEADQLRMISLCLKVPLPPLVEDSLKAVG